MGFDRTRIPLFQLVAIILVVFICIGTIVVLASPLWYHVDYTLFNVTYTFNVGLFKYKECFQDTCTKHSIGDLDDSDLNAASTIAIVGLVIALIVCVVFFIMSALSITGRTFGKLDQRMIGIINIIVSIVMVVTFCAVLILYPIIFGGAQDSGDYLNWNEGYYWAYYGMIGLVVLSIVVTVLEILDTLPKIRKGNYTPLEN